MPPKVDIPAARNVIFEPNPGPQTEFLSATEQEVLYGGSAGGGKAVFEHQNLLTPHGWKNIKEVKLGDTIVGCDGKSQTITHLFAWESLPIFEVELDDGTVFDAAGEHLWYYWLAGQSSTQVKSTKEMWEHSLKFGRLPIIPTVSPVDFDSQLTEVDAYTLGAILGDGCITTNSISFACHGDDWDHFKEKLSFQEKDMRRSGITTRIVGESRKAFVDYLKSQNLLGVKSEGKFVPNEFLLNSVEVRKDLLRGLMDTDGYRDKGRARAEFTSVSSKLADAVKFIAQSLGYRVSTYEKVGSYRNVIGEKVCCQKVYRLYITGRNVDDLFSLGRKKVGVEGKQLGRRVLDVRKTNRTGVARCISVSNQDGLYVTDDFIVTHNSYAMIADPIYGVNNEHFAGILFRRTNDELRELKSKTQMLYPRAIKGAKWSERDSQWRFPSGATLWMTYLDKEDDVLRYQGQAFSWIGFDELTQWPSPHAWDYMRSRLRTTTGSNLKRYMRATSNPGGPGHLWVKKMFIDPAPWGTAFDAQDIETGKTLQWPKGHTREGEPLFQRKFVPARLSDNPYLAQDGYYEANLLSLPEHQRQQLLEGSWDVSEGAAFPEWNRDIHVVEPFEIPKNWLRFRACDYGYGSNSGVLWFVVDPADEQLVVYREMYTSLVTAVDLADMVLEAEEGENIRYGMLDSSLWHNRGDTGPSLAEQMIKRGCRWRPSDRSKGSRVASKNELHRRLQVDEFTGRPRIVFFRTCLNTIAQLPLLPLDKKNPEDVDTKTEDHLYDALRYGLMSRPKSASIWDISATKTPSTYTAVDKTFGY